MRIFIIIALALNSLVFASSYLDQKAQDDIISFVAKVERKYLWKAGHKRVNSNFFVVSEDNFDAYLNRSFDESLSKSAIANIRGCFKAEECVVYNIRIESVYNGNYGADSVFVLLNIKSGDYDADFRHNIFSE